jgi:hypothetical protein
MRAPFAFALLLLLLLPGPARADGGWLGGTFEADAEVTQDPAQPTEADSVQIFLRVRNSTIAINFAFLTYYVKFPGTNRQDGPYNATFIPEAFSNNRRLFAPALPPRPNGTEVTYTVLAYDFFNVPRQSLWYNFTVQGEVRSKEWRFDTFEENLGLAWAPQAPEAHEPVNLTIRSLSPDVLISAAHLFIRYHYFDNPPQEGGFVFQRAGNDTLAAHIPGYPAGTTVFFWVIAYDPSNNPMTSPVLNYTLSVDRYTANPPEPYPSPEAVAGSVLAAAVAAPIVAWFALRLRGGARRRA